MDTRTCERCQAELGPDAPAGMCPRCLLQLAQDHPSFGPQPPQQPTENRDSDRALPPKPEQIAGLFPELEILDIVGHGGMGYVYKARQKNLGRIVAVKLLSTQLLDDPAFAERFSREARAMAMMNHPNIIAIYDFGCRDKYYYLVMEYVDGLNLRQLVSTGEIQPAEAIQLVPQLCDALQYAHDRGVVHRDIKPENVLVSQEGQVKIADFGLAKLTNLQQNLTLTQTRQIMGTPNYMAPEQREKPIDVDHRADIYSLGVVIYELLTGELPLGRFAPPSTKAQVDARIDELVMRALEKEPGLRYQQVSELKTGFESLATPAQPQVPPVAAAIAPGLSPGFPPGVTATGASQRGFLIGQFVFMSVGILLGIGGILMIILSGLIDHNGDTIFTERFFQISGFVGLACCGATFALYGIYVSVFHPKPTPGSNSSVTEEGADDEYGKPLPVLFLNGLGTVMVFVCAAFFTIGSLIPGISSWQGGIGSALLAGCIYSIAELVEKAYGPKTKDGVPLKACPLCGTIPKSQHTTHCHVCGCELK